ncbi:MAG: guanitoxin biosynthesis MBL fold metallo-hydrolase GntH [Betaproteobacteria bacterium]
MNIPNSSNPYGGVPGGGITLPPYYRPTPSVRNYTTFFSETETLGPDEMRVTFMGSIPWPPRHGQAGTCIMVELGNGNRFFFDFGSGCMRNIIGLQVPLIEINDIFLTHLHVDHYADLPYLFCFGPFAGRWTPLRVTGPSGRLPEFGTRAMIDGMKQMTRWHWNAFSIAPVGDGYEVEVNEFDWRDDNGICYQKDGVTVRHWRRIHSMDGASAYRLDWNGLSFVWTGDGRPDEKTIEFARGADVFVTECLNDTVKIFAAKFRAPERRALTIMDNAHTSHYAVGYMMKQINPRLGAICHFVWDHDMLGETMAGIREHWKGLFQFGLDGTVLNVTRDAVWSRTAVLPEYGHSAPPDLNRVFNGNIPEEMTLPTPKRNILQEQEQATRDGEIDSAKYCPPDLWRPKVLPSSMHNLRVNTREFFGQPDGKRR